MKCSFGSDNHAGVDNVVMQAIIEANQQDARAYGADEHTALAIAQFKALFKQDLDVHFAITGTAANILALAPFVESYHAILCSDVGHIHIDECAAPEKFMGCKVIPVDSHHGKINIKVLEKAIRTRGIQHHAQPRVVSITQSTELGTIYTLEEIKQICDFAHQHDMFVHMDGARIANAVAALNVDIASMTNFAGIDVLSFGGTKNGMMFGEAILFFNKTFSQHCFYLKKQAMQLISKMRFLGAQFNALLKEERWLKNAQSANHMAQLLARALIEIKGVTISKPVQANAVFVQMPKQAIVQLQPLYGFYMWNEEINEIRLMCSFKTKEEDINGFIIDLKKSLLGLSLPDKK